MILWMKFASLGLGADALDLWHRRAPHGMPHHPVTRRPEQAATRLQRGLATSFLGDKLPGQSSHAVDDRLYELYEIVLFRPITYFRTVTTCGKMSYVSCAEAFGKRPAKRDAARAHS
jgi:hypothetical protein